MNTARVPTHLTARQRAIVVACDVPRSLTELMERAGVTHRSHFRSKHLKPLLEAGVLRMTNPENPRAPNQKDVLTKTGVGLKAAGAGHKTMTARLRDDRPGDLFVRERDRPYDPGPVTCLGHDLRIRGRPPGVLLEPPARQAAGAAKAARFSARRRRGHSAHVEIRRTTRRARIPSWRTLWSITAVPTTPPRNITASPTPWTSVSGRPTSSTAPIPTTPRCPTWPSCPRSCTTRSLGTSCSTASAAPG